MCTHTLSFKGLFSGLRELSVDCEEAFGPCAHSQPTVSKHWRHCRPL